MKRGFISGRGGCGGIAAWMEQDSNISSPFLAKVVEDFDFCQDKAKSENLPRLLFLGETIPHELVPLLPPPPTVYFGISLNNSRISQEATL